MRRLVAFVALVLVALGLELSTQTITLTISRMSAGIQAVFAGVDFFLPKSRFIIGLVFVVGGLVLAVLLLWAGRARKSVGIVGSSCPNCGSRTRRVRRKRSQRLLSLLVGQRIARRKCETCGWIGLALRD